LVVPQVPAGFSLDIETRIIPERNTALSGLYISAAISARNASPKGFAGSPIFSTAPM